jgi:hypothetical protein
MTQQMQQQMQPLEALDILLNAAAQARLTLADHGLVRQAAEVIRESLPSPLAEVPKPEPAKSTVK